MKKMKLVGFKKMNKQKKIVVSSIVGILLIIGSILLYRSYALYEEKKEFNVLKGKIPDFGYDIKMLSVVVDGKKSTNIPSRGLYKTQIDCSNGTRGEWDYNAWNLTLENVSENARCNITFTSNLSEEEYDKYIEAGKALRRNTYRGKDITTYHNDGSLYEMISSGRFDDIYVGDYIVANNVTWLVADIDNYLYTGDTLLTKHHLTIVPAKPLIDIHYSDLKLPAGGYLNSEMVKTILPSSSVLGVVSSVFSTHLLTYRSLLTNSVDANRISAGLGIDSGSSNDYIWASRQIDLMSEANVYGGIVFSSSGYDIGIDNLQYAIFELKPEYIISYDGSTFGFWLKNFADSNRLSHVGAGGYSGNGATQVSGIRPRFLIG